MYCPYCSGSVKNTASAVKKAMDLQKAMDANYGGTEMIQPFKAIYNIKPIKNYPRKVRNVHVFICLVH